METILVTGGWGHLGRYLVVRLAAEGHRVRVLTRASHRDNPRPTDAGEEVFFGDIRDDKAVSRAVAGADSVVHLVANFRRAGTDAKEAYSINVEGTLNVLRATVAHETPRLIHCSTIGVHGDVQDIPADEDSPFNPGDKYQETKLIAERKVWEVAEKAGLAATVIRPVAIYGPGDRRLLKLFRMIKKGWFLRVGNGKTLYHPAYVDDVVEGFVLALTSERAIGGTFIIGSDRYLTLNELATAIARELGVKLRTVQLPSRAMEIAATICENVCPRVGLEPPIHHRRLGFYSSNRAFSVEKAKTILGYRPAVSLAEGLHRTASWYRDHGWL